MMYFSPFTPKTLACGAQTTVLAAAMRFPDASFRYVAADSNSLSGVPDELLLVEISLREHPMVCF